jgi:hypothetical protein
VLAVPRSIAMSRVPDRPMEDRRPMVSPASVTCGHRLGA